MHREADALVEVALRASEFDELGDLGLGRELGRDLLFGPAQEERPDAGRELLAPGPAPVSLDRNPEHPAEPLLVTEQAGHQDVEQRPQLAEVILHRGSGQA